MLPTSLWLKAPHKSRLRMLKEIRKLAKKLKKWEKLENQYLKEAEELNIKIKNTPPDIRHIKEIARDIEEFYSTITNLINDYKSKLESLDKIDKDTARLLNDELKQAEEIFLKIREIALKHEIPEALAKELLMYLNEEGKLIKEALASAEYITRKERYGRSIGISFNTDEAMYRSIASIAKDIQKILYHEEDYKKMLEEAIKNKDPNQLENLVKDITSLYVDEITKIKEIHTKSEKLILSEMEKLASILKVIDEARSYAAMKHVPEIYQEKLDAAKRMIIGIEISRKESARSRDKIYRKIKSS